MLNLPSCCWSRGSESRRLYPPRPRSRTSRRRNLKKRKTSSIKSYGIKHLACVWRPCNRVNLNALKSRERRRVWGHQRVALGTFLSRWWPRQTGGFSRDKFIKGFVPPLSLGLGGGGGLTRASKERESTSAGFRGTETDANLFHERKKRR